MLLGHRPKPRSSEQWPQSSVCARPSPSHHDGVNDDPAGTRCGRKSLWLSNDGSRRVLCSVEACGPLLGVTKPPSKGWRFCRPCCATALPQLCDCWRYCQQHHCCTEHGAPAESNMNVRVRLLKHLRCAWTPKSNVHAPAVTLHMKVMDIWIR